MFSLSTDLITFIKIYLQRFSFLLNFQLISPADRNDCQKMIFFFG